MMSPALFYRLMAGAGLLKNLRGSDPLGSDPVKMEVAVALIEQSGRYLISQRLAQDSFGGLWEFPGGTVNPGETLEECVAREVQEELGIAVAVGEKLQVVEYEHPQRAIRLHCFSCRIVSGEPQAIECAAWRWVSTRDLAGYEFPPASRALLAQFGNVTWGTP